MGESECGAAGAEGGVDYVGGGDDSFDGYIALFTAQQITNCLYYVNFAVDFFVFSVTSSIFRRNIARCLHSL